MRWQGQAVDERDGDALPGLESMGGLVRSVTTPEFQGMTFHEVLAKSALNHVPGSSAMPFDWTVNPYRGCSHACVYCLDPETQILMGDGRMRRLAELTVGDEIIGTEKSGAYRRYRATRVLAKWHTRKRAYRVSLADGTDLIASADHRFLTDRGWKHVKGAMSGAEQRPHLTVNNRLMGFGIGAVRAAGSLDDARYRRGYLTGMILGDGMIVHKEYTYPHRTMAIHAFRLALADEEALDRTRTFLHEEGIRTSTRPFAPATDDRRAITAIHTGRRTDIERLELMIKVPGQPSHSWYAGFLGGVFDAEGSCSRGVVRISNKSDLIVRTIQDGLREFGLSYTVEPARPNGVISVRLTGGLPVRQRFFTVSRPAITRKLGIRDTTIKTVADLRVVAIDDLGYDIDMVDITTGTGDFIANGVVSHNCFARKTHEYLDLDSGADFDNQIVVKVNVGEVLRRELAKPTWKGEAVALGTNTDPYQRAEGRYRLMPEIIDALASHGTPFSILTKGTLLRRDLPLLVDARAKVPVRLAMSIAVPDDTLRHLLEPGAPSFTARLETVRAATAAGFSVSVFLMPIVPHLTDTVEMLDDALGRIAAAGARRVVFGAMHLRPGAKQWFWQWLERERPDLVPVYRGLYPGASVSAPQGYRKLLASRVRPLLRRHGLGGGVEEEVENRPARPGPILRTKPRSQPVAPTLF